MRAFLFYEPQNTRSAAQRGTKDGLILYVGKRKWCQRPLVVGFYYKGDIGQLQYFQVTNLKVLELAMIGFIIMP